MNIGTIVTPNTKGQLVIPQKIRDSLAISPTTPLQITVVGKAIMLQPIKSIINYSDFETSYSEILKKTQGSWYSLKQTSKDSKRALELKATARRKKQIW